MRTKKKKNRKRQKENEVKTGIWAGRKERQIVLKTKLVLQVRNICKALIQISCLSHLGIHTICISIFTCMFIHIYRYITVLTGLNSSSSIIKKKKTHPKLEYNNVSCF